MIRKAKESMYLKKKELERSLFRLNKDFVNTLLGIYFNSTVFNDRNIQNYTLRLIHMYKEPADEELLSESDEFKKEF